MATMLIVTRARIAGGPNPGEPWEVDAEYGKALIAQGKAEDASSLKARLGPRGRAAAAAGATASQHDRQAVRSALIADPPPTLPRQSPTADYAAPKTDDAKPTPEDKAAPKATG